MLSASNSKTITPLNETLSSSSGITMAQVRSEIADSIGKGVQLGFDGTLENNILTFIPPTGSYGYNIKENYDYEIDLSFQATSLQEMDDETAIVIINEGDTYRFWTIKDTPATWGDLKDIYTYDTSIGYRWLFKARFHISSANENIFYIYPTVNKNSSSYTLPMATSETLGGVKVNDDIIYIDAEGTIGIPIAEKEQLGVVKPDGSTISVDENGVMKSLTNAWTYIKDDDYHDNDIHDQYQTIQHGFYCLYSTIFQLPEDENDYEVLFDIMGEHQSSDYETVELYVSSDYLMDKYNASDDYMFLLFSMRPNTARLNADKYGTRCVIPVGKDRQIKIKNNGTADAQLTRLRILAYRGI